VSLTDRKVKSIDHKKVPSGCTSTYNKSNKFIYASSYAELLLERGSETYRTAWQLETLEMKASPWNMRSSRTAEPLYSVQYIDIIFRTVKDFDYE
jgi:hypothetical protein